LTSESDRSLNPSAAQVEALGHVPAIYFDGQHSTPHSVIVALQPSMIVVSGAGVSRSAPLHEVDITEGPGATPRLIRFRDGAFCEVENAAALETLLSASRITPRRVTRWEGRLWWVTVSAVLFVAGLIAGYRYAVPALAIVAAEQVPDPVVDLISREVLSALDKQVFEATVVPPDRQAQLVERFGRLRFPSVADSNAYDIIFRKSELLGPNAMALPSGTLVITDALVALAQKDEEIIAVLAHEAGHVVRRHGLRQLFQNSVVALAITWLVGDVSVLAAAAPTALLQANYSRDLEREADSHAVDVLRINNISLEHFALILERLEKSAREDGRAGGGALGYLSSHPVTSERIERVRRPEVTTPAP